MKTMWQLIFTIISHKELNVECDVF